MWYICSTKRVGKTFLLNYLNLLLYDVIVYPSQFLAHKYVFRSENQRRCIVQQHVLLHWPRQHLANWQNSVVFITETDDSNHASTEEIEQSHLVQYPDNLNLKDIFYFICAPTLCYELNFPRTQRIRKRFLLKRIFEVLVGIQIIFAVMQQYMIPSVKNSLIPFSNMDITKATERLLKLAVCILNFEDIMRCVTSIPE